MCLGFRHGTDCRRRVKAPQRRTHWDKYQLCYNCASDDATLEYRNELDETNPGLIKIPIIH